MLRITVKAYNDHHRRVLASRAEGSRLGEILDRNLEVAENDLLTYAMFREQKDEPNWRTYQDLARIVETRTAQFWQYFDFSDGSIRSRFARGPSTDPALTEAMGVGIGLSVVSRIYGLTEADWTKIPVGPIRSLDFEIASDGREIIQVEVKGSVVGDAERLSDVSSYRRDIEEKKETQRRHGNASVMYEAIAAIPDRPSQNAICYLLDPNGVQEDLQPYVHRVVARLYYYYIHLRAFSRAHFLIALRNRISELIAINNAMLDRIPLVNINGEPFGIPGSLIEAHSLIPDYAVGAIAVVDSERIFFHGTRLEVIEPLLKQDFNALLALKFDEDADQERRVEIIVRVDREQAQRLGLPGADEEAREESEKYEIRMAGLTRCNSAGRVYGWAQVRG